MRAGAGRLGRRARTGRDAALGDVAADRRGKVRAVEAVVDDRSARLQEAPDRPGQRSEDVVERRVGEQGAEELVEVVLAVPPSGPEHDALEVRLEIGRAHV